MTKANPGTNICPAINNGRIDAEFHHRIVAEPAVATSGTLSRNDPTAPEASGRSSREEIGSHKATENRFRLLYAILSQLSVCEIDIRNSGGFGIVFYLKERFVLQFKPAGNPL